MAWGKKPSANLGTNAPSADSGGWEDAPTEFVQRCVLMSIWGPTGSGRTRLALTAPGPIAFAHAGEKIQGVVQAAAREKQVKVHNFGGVFGGSVQDISNQASAIWNPFEAKIKAALVNTDFQSTVVDTDTEAWELLRLAFFGELNPKGRTDSLYGPVNARWRSIFKAQRREAAARVSAPNLIVIGQAKDEYVMTRQEGGKKSSERTGKLLQAGQKEVAYNSDVVIETSRDISNGDFVATIRKGWWNAAAVEGISLTNEDITFAKIMSIVTETEEPEWA